MSRVIRLLTLLIMFATGSLVVLPQNAPATKPTLKKADYDKFEAIGSSALSPDGKWIAYAVTRGERGAARGPEAPIPSTVHYRALSASEDKTISGAGNPTFTSNSRWMLYTIAPAGGAGGGGRGGRGGRGGAGGN